MARIRRSVSAICLALHSSPVRGSNAPQLQMMTYAPFTLGFGIGPIVEVTLYINPSILPTAFLSTALIFACFTLSSIYGDRRKTLYFGGLLFSGLSLITYMAIFNIFFNSYAIYKVTDHLIT